MMEALLRKTLSGEIRGLLKGRLDHINQQYPRVRRAYRHAYGVEALDRLRTEAGLSTILGLYTASAALSDELLRSFLASRLTAFRSSGHRDAAGDHMTGNDTAALVARARDEGVLVENDAAALQSAYAATRKLSALDTPASANSATAFFLAVDSAVRRHFEQARAA